MRALIFAVTAALSLAACERPQARLDAAEDIHAFLQAAREGDRATFDRHVDREALKANLRGELDEVLAGQTVPARLRDQLLDQMVDSFGPEMFQLATRGGGPLANRTPTTPEIAAALRPLSQSRVCLPSAVGAEDCAVTFEKKEEVWKLVAVDASGIRIGSGLPSPGEFLERFPVPMER